VNPEDDVQQLELAPIQLEMVKVSCLQKLARSCIYHPISCQFELGREFRWAEIVENKIEIARASIIFGNPNKALMASNAKQTSKHWYADSGCTQHMMD
jgi:hypothetical protein